jgi:hypothetical protein
MRPKFGPGLNPGESDPGCQTGFRAQSRPGWDETNKALGFSVPKHFIGERESSEVDQGGLTTRGRGQGLGHAPSW